MSDKDLIMINLFNSNWKKMQIVNKQTRKNRKYTCNCNGLFTFKFWSIFIFLFFLMINHSLLLFKIITKFITINKTLSRNKIIVTKQYIIQLPEKKLRIIEKSIIYNGILLPLRRKAYLLLWK